MWVDIISEAFHRGNRPAIWRAVTWGGFLSDATATLLRPSQIHFHGYIAQFKIDLFLSWIWCQKIGFTLPPPLLSLTWQRKHIIDKELPKKLQFVNFKWTTASHLHWLVFNIKMHDGISWYCCCFSCIRNLKPMLAKLGPHYQADHMFGKECELHPWICHCRERERNPRLHFMMMNSELAQEPNSQFFYFEIHLKKSKFSTWIYPWSWFRKFILLWDKEGERDKIPTKKLGTKCIPYKSCTLQYLTSKVSSFGDVGKRGDEKNWNCIECFWIERKNLCKIKDF